VVRTYGGVALMRSGIADVVWGVFIVLLAASPFLVLALFAQPPTPADTNPITLTDVAQGIRTGDITAVDVSDNQATVTDVYGQQYGVRFSPATKPLRELTAFGVTQEELTHVRFVVHDPSPASTWWATVVNLLPAVVMGTLLVIVARSGPAPNSQLINLTRHHGRRFVDGPESIRFADVAGVDEAKQELQEVVEFLGSPEKFASLGARIPKGVLLVGPPGTGKTLLARAVAGEANVPFFNISGSEFVEIVAGVGASRVRDLFAEAQRNAPCLLFVDELDAIGRHRGASMDLPNEEREQALNQILVEMDGFDSNSRVIVLGATNRADVLDRALLRAGRFDRQVLVANPDLAGRKAILEVHVRNKPLEPSVDLGVLARLTPGFSGADLANVANEAAILAARRRGRSISMSELEEAIDRVVAGPRSISRVIASGERLRTAYHEGGHALAMRYLEHHPPVHKVSIVPHGRLTGYTRCIPASDESIATRGCLRAMLAAALGGHAAEKLILGDVSSSAEDDIIHATELATRMIKRYGMSEHLGPVALESADDAPRTYSDRTAEIIDVEIHAMIEDGYRRATAILTEHRASLEHLASSLLESETLEGEALERAFGACSGGLAEGSSERGVLPCSMAPWKPA
jgi:cell division protease FtsH